MVVVVVADPVHIATLWTHTLDDIVLLRLLLFSNATA